ncbi:response regulator [Candidatus Dojkabacteria bacterium]|nr:response regulator [Candidatus Dojkabacteria bacterium]
MGNNKRILVVEDEIDVLALYKDALVSSGFEVESVSNGQEALDILSTDKFDIILLDIVMPVLDGVETLRQIKSDTNKYGTMPVVMLSNIGGDVAIDKALEYGADGYLLKSETDVTELADIVNKYLA